MVKIIKMGCLQFNGMPVELGVPYSKERISFGDSIPGNAIPFVKWGELLVASRCICMGVSWEELDSEGFILGRPITIDGTSYLCRSLKVGEDDDTPSEWDAILDDLGEDDFYWNWFGQFFWGQEAVHSCPPTCACRGYDSARHWEKFGSGIRDSSIGFRPILEPLPPAPLLSNFLIGSNLAIHGPGSEICGKLVDFNEYDLVIHPPVPLALLSYCNWAVSAGDNIIIDRSAVVWMKEN